MEHEIDRAPGTESGHGVATAVSAITALENEARELANHAKWSAAARTLTRAARAEPHNTGRWLQIAQWQRKNHDIKAAIRTLQTALRLNRVPDSPLPDSSKDLIELWEALAETQLEAQSWKECITTCRTLLQHAPRHHFGQELLATALLQTGQIDEAIEVMRNLLYLSPRDPLHRLKLATLLQLQGNFGDALREFQRVVEAHPDLLFVQEAFDAIEALDRMQTQQILLRAAEEHVFRLHLQQDFDATLEEGGFYLSEGGRESLRHMLWDGRADDPGSIPTPRVH